MSIRRLVPADAESYRALMLEAYEAHPDAFTSSPEERRALPLAWWESRVADSEGATDIVFGAFSDQQLLGVAGLHLERRAKTRHRATLFGMYVRPASRRRRLGDQLVGAILTYAVSRPTLRVVQLTVSEGNHPARSLYERHGFTVFGIEPLAVSIGDGYVSKVHMYIDLGKLSGAEC